MRRNGFTLVEIIVSISLVSIVLVAMLSTLVRLRGVYATINDDTDIRVSGSSISKIINNDIKDNCGIKEIICPSKTSCTLTLGNDASRTITLKVHETKEEGIEVPNAEAEAYGTRLTTRTTIEYKDAINDKKLLTKTLKSITETTTTIVNNKPKEETSTTSYHLTGMSHKRNAYTTTSDSKVIYSLTIEATDPKYNIRIYSIGA